MKFFKKSDNLEIDIKAVQRIQKEKLPEHPENPGSYEEALQGRYKAEYTNFDLSYGDQETLEQYTARIPYTTGMHNEKVTQYNQDHGVYLKKVEEKQIIIELDPQDFDGTGDLSEASKKQLNSLDIHILNLNDNVTLRFTSELNQALQETVRQLKEACQDYLKHPYLHESEKKGMHVCLEALNTKENPLTQIKQFEKQLKNFERDIQQTPALMERITLFLKQCWDIIGAGFSKEAIQKSKSTLSERKSTFDKKQAEKQGFFSSQLKTLHLTQEAEDYFIKEFKNAMSTEEGINACLKHKFQLFESQGGLTLDQLDQHINDPSLKKEIEDRLTPELAHLEDLALTEKEKVIVASVIHAVAERTNQSLGVDITQLLADPNNAKNMETFRKIQDIRSSSVVEKMIREQIEVYREKNPPRSPSP